MILSRLIADAPYAAGLDTRPFGARVVPDRVMTQSDNVSGEDWKDRRAAGSDGDHVP